MRLADFIDANLPKILTEWDLFASTLLPAAGLMDAAELRDHAEQMLKTITMDLRTPQSSAEQLAKSQGHLSALAETPETAAQTHALARALSGFDIRQLVAEYRALRASVFRLWSDAGGYGPEAMEDARRFNEAVDQAIAESVDYFSREVDRRRDLLLGTIGHDLRGPLNAMSLIAQVISAMSAEEVVRQNAEKIIRSGKRMRQLLDDLLDYNRTSLAIGMQAHLEPLDLVSICREEVDLLRATLPAFTIEFESDGVVPGNWDASRIKQAISNLVTNAAKYGDPDGTIRVSLHTDNAHIYLSVENTGPSIPKELMNSLFEPLRRHGFSDSSSERVSLGLGLFIVRQVTLAHRGSITVESAGGRTCFTIKFPR